MCWDLFFFFPINGASKYQLCIFTPSRNPHHSPLTRCPILSVKEEKRPGIANQRPGGKENRMRWTASLERPHTGPSRRALVFHFFWGLVWIAETMVCVLASWSIGLSFRVGLLFLNFLMPPSGITGSSSPSCVQGLQQVMDLVRPVTLGWLLPSLWQLC